MSDRGRVLAICAGVALVAGGAGFYFFQIYQPAQQLKDAQAEITSWEQRYQDARDCLLGKSPGSAKTSEALAIREMAPDPWDRGKCTPLVSKLTRGPANDTGVEAVEAAWGELDKAAQAAAVAFAKHVASLTNGGDPLPGALDALDSARAKLRTSARLPASTVAGTALKPVEIVPISDGADPVTNLAIDSLPSAHGLVVYGHTARRELQIVLTAGSAPKVVRTHSREADLRAVPDLSWGASPGPLTVQKNGTATGEVDVGAMDGEGVIAAPQVVALSVPVTPAAPGEPALRAGEPYGAPFIGAAIGSLADGALVYGMDQSLVIARAKANTVTADPPIKIDVATSAMDVDGRAAVVWTTRDKVNRALVLRAGGEDAFELPASFQGSPCLTNDRVWVMAAEPELFAFGGGKPLERMKTDAYAALQGCTADAAIVRNRERHREVAICTGQCRKVLVPSGAPEYASVTAIGGKLVAVAAHAGVVGVWSEDKPPVFYALPETAIPVFTHGDPTLALTNGKVIDVIAQADKKVILIRIPAS